MNGTAVIEARRDGCVTHLLLNRPDRGNCLSAKMVQELQEWIARCADEETAVVTLRGAGKHFCTGFDVSDIEAETDDSLVGRFVRIELVLQAIHNAPFVSVALVRGRAIGAGADLVAACEQRWHLGGGPEPTFSFPGAGFGVILGTSRLARLVGHERARRWVRSGRSVNLAEALESGLLQRTVAEGEVGAEMDCLGAEALRLEKPTLSSVHAATRHHQDAGDLYSVASSSARLGLSDRIAKYRRAGK
jgi:enoyl-CoA hydratase